MAKAREVVIVMEDDTILHYKNCDNIFADLENDCIFKKKEGSTTATLVDLKIAKIKFEYEEFKMICPRGAQKPSMTWQTFYEPVRSVIIE